MTQRIAYGLLQELGGTAKMEDIIKLCIQKYPNDSHHKYGKLSTHLGKLRKWNIVKMENGKWTIMQEWKQ